MLCSTPPKESSVLRQVTFRQVLYCHWPKALEHPPPQRHLCSVHRVFQIKIDIPHNEHLSRSASSARVYITQFKFSAGLEHRWSTTDGLARISSKNLQEVQEVGTNLNVNDGQNKFKVNVSKNVAKIANIWPADTLARDLLLDITRSFFIRF